MATDEEWRQKSAKGTRVSYRKNKQPTTRNQILTGGNGENGEEVLTTEARIRSDTPYLNRKKENTTNVKDIEDKGVSR